MSEPSTPSGSAPDGQHTVAKTELKAGAIGLPGVLMQGVTSIAPAIAALFTLPFIVSNAGITAPLAYLGAFVIALMLGFVLAQFSKYMTSTGTYYTYVSNSLGGRMGFLVAWVYLLFYPVVVAQVGSFMGDTLQGTLKAEYGWNFKWWYFMIFLIILVALTAWRGIELSTGLVVDPRRDRDADRARNRDLRLRRSGAGRRQPLGVQPEQRAERARALPRRRLRDLRHLGLGRGGSARRGERGSEEDDPEGRDGLHHHHGLPARLRLVGADHGLGRRQRRQAPELVRAAGVRPRSQVLGRRVGDRAHRAAELGDRGRDRDHERGDAVHLRHGANRRLPEAADDRPQEVQDAVRCDRVPDVREHLPRPDPAARGRRGERLQHHRHVVHVRARPGLRGGQRRHLLLRQEAPPERLQLVQARARPGGRDRGACVRRLLLAEPASPVADQAGAARRRRAGSVSGSSC